MPNRHRVIIALPNIAECGMVADWLTDEGFEPVRRSNPRAAAEDMRARAFDLLIVDGTIAICEGLLTAGRGRHPSIPAVVVSDASAGEQRQTESRHAIYVERPVERAMLVCTVSLAILDGRPVRCSARKPVNRFAAMVNGVPSHLIDVSNEGLRLEMPSDRRAVTPPFFTLQIPLVGVGVIVQRKWTRSRPGQGQSPMTLCGGTLTHNRPSAESAWRVFVDMIPVVGGNPPSSLPIR